MQNLRTISNTAIRPQGAREQNNTLHDNALSSGLMSATSRYWPNRAQPQNGNLISAINPYDMTHEHSSIPLDVLQQNIQHVKQEMKKLREEYHHKLISHKNYHKRLTKLHTEYATLQAAIAKSSRYANFNRVINGVPEHTANLIYDDSLVETMNEYRQDTDFGLHRDDHDTPGHYSRLDQGFMVNLRNKMLTPQEILMGISQQDKEKSYKIGNPDRLGANPNTFISTAPPLWQLSMQMYDLPDDTLNRDLVNKAVKRIQAKQDQDSGYYTYYELKRYPHNHIIE